MLDNPLPQELHQRWGNLRFIRQRTSNTWSSECPICRDSGHFGNDDPDRFTMWAAELNKGARGWCRACSYFSWADEDNRLSREQIELATQERIRLLEQENKRIKEKIQRIADADFWRRWHDEMTVPQRELWHREGINDWAIETYSLGYCNQYRTWYKGREWQSPSMTIPHYGHNWQIRNIQHRLLIPPQPNDKYRNTAGIPMTLFLTEPGEELTGPVLMIEGAKKSIVVYLNLGHKIQVNAFPSKTPSPEMLDQLSNCDPIYLALDPDSYDGQAQKIGERLGLERVRFVHFPEKPDDMIVRYGIDRNRIWRYVEKATVTA